MDNNELDRLRAGDRATWNNLYRECHKIFIAWAFKISKINEEDAEDAFQEASLIMSTRAINGDLPSLINAIQRLFIKIAKNQLYNILREKNKPKSCYRDILYEIEQECYYILLDELENPRLDILIKCLEELAENEKTFIELHYCKKLDLKTIAEQMKFKSEDVAKHIHYRIKKKLKKMIEEEMRRLDG
jgi:RNA polymerase sigma factor (sigma-70 family)